MKSNSADSKTIGYEECPIELWLGPRATTFTKRCSH